MLAGIAAPFVEVRLLAIPAVMLPMGLIWFVLQQRMDGRREERAGQAGETTETSPASGPRAVAAIVATVLLVGGFVTLMGWIAGLI